MLTLLPKQSVRETTTNSPRKLIIGNVGGESLVGDLDLSNQEQNLKFANLAGRLVWLAQAGDIVLTPAAVSREYVQYALSLMRVDADTVTVMHPDGVDEDTFKLLTYEQMGHPELCDRLKTQMAEAGAEWEILPYYFDRGVAALAQQLPVQNNPRLLDFFRNGGGEMFNSKIEFRRIAAAADIPVANGANCYSLAEFCSTISSLIEETGSVMIKQDINASCEGNYVLTLDADRTQSAGAIQTRQYASKAELFRDAEQVWRTLTGVYNASLVVEVYHETTSVFYSELEIKEGGVRPYLLNFGDQRMEPIWSGFEIPSMSLGPYAIGTFISCSMQLAEEAARRGFVGKMSCDGMLTADGHVLFTEINGRLGGCTHIHIVAETLYGSQYGSKYTILTRNHVEVKHSFSQLLQRLRDENLLVTGPHQEGVLIMLDNIHSTQTVDYMVVGQNQQSALQLEQRALEIFK